MKCPCCEGKKGWDENFGEGTHIWQGCPVCETTGKAPFMVWFWDKAPVELVEIVGDILMWWDWHFGQHLPCGCRGWCEGHPGRFMSGVRIISSTEEET